jgi:hypothetical protein
MTPRAIFEERTQARIDAGCDFMVLGITVLSVVCAVVSLFYAWTTPT